MQLLYIKNQNSYLNVAIILNKGSNSERFGENGYTHILEHCFLGLIEINGECQVQAYTEFDHMEIHFISRENTYEECTKIFKNINKIFITGRISETILKAAMDEVLCEIRNGNNSMSSELLKAISDGSMNNIPIGCKSDIEKITVDKIENYKTYYLNQCDLMILVCGDNRCSYENLELLLHPKLKSRNVETASSNGDSMVDAKFHSDILVRSGIVQKLICRYEYDIKTIKSKLIQIIGDQLIEEGAKKSGEFLDITISYKYFDEFFKLLIITLYYDRPYVSAMGLNDFIILIKNVVTEHDFANAINKTETLFKEYFQYGVTIPMLLAQTKNNFLYGEPELFYSISYIEIEKCIESISYEEIVDYFSDLDNGKCKLLFEIKEVQDETRIAKCN